VPFALAVAGLLMTIVGGVSYYFLLEVPWIRATGWPNLVVMLIGLALGIASARRARRKLTLGLVIGQVLFIALFVVSLTVFTALPEPQSSAEVASRQAPDFTLPDHTGKSVSLAEALARGPVLLVFYRGFW
jgi:hypothetical protein